MGTTLFRFDFRRYGIAGLSVVLAVLAVSVLRPLIGENISPVLLAPWILLGAWYGGLGAGLMSTALNAVAAAYFIPPADSFRIADRSGWVELAIFALQGVLISWLCESRRRMAVARAGAVREAQQARADAQHRSRALAEVKAHLKHLSTAFAAEVQGRLTMLRCHVEALESGVDAEAGGRLRSIQSNAARMDAFAVGLAAYARVDGAPIRKANVDAARMVQRVLERFVQEIRDSGAEITSKVPSIMLEGDAPQLECVFENLIGNALKFRGAEAPWIRIRWEQRKGRHMFTVADNGIGIVPARWEEVFALGRRLNGDRYPGAGMGLAIARRIVENHGGEIWLNSESGRGTTVRFTIPR